MTTPRPQTTTGTAEREDAAEGGVPEGGLSIFDSLSPEDRAALDRALVRSRAGVYASDEEVEAAFALFGP